MSAGNEEYEVGELSVEEQECFGRDFISQEYPIFNAESRAAPPEDCGEVGGYERLLEALVNPDHPRHESIKGWAGRTMIRNALILTEWNSAILIKFCRLNYEGSVRLV